MYVCMVSVYTETVSESDIFRLGKREGERASKEGEREIHTHD